MLTEQLATSTPERLMDETVRTKVSFMEQCKESTTKEGEKNKYNGKQHRNNSQDVARVLKKNQDGKISENRNTVAALYLRLIYASHMGINIIFILNGTSKFL